MVTLDEGRYLVEVSITDNQRSDDGEFVEVAKLRFSTPSLIRYDLAAALSVEVLMSGSPQGKVTETDEWLK